MKRLLVVSIAVFFGLVSLGMARALADNGNWIVQKLQVEQAIQLALLVRAQNVEETLNEDLAFYRPLSVEAINRTTDVRILRAQVIAAQEAAQKTRDVVAANMSAASAQSMLQAATLTSALATAVTQPQLSKPFTYPIGGTRVLAVYDTTSSGLAPTVSPATSTACSVMSYVTGVFGASGPQFISSTGETTGQKNTLSIIGAALGIVPVAMNCTTDHITSPSAGQQQQPPPQQ